MNFAKLIFDIRGANSCRTDGPTLGVRNLTEMYKVKKI